MEETRFGLPIKNNIRYLAPLILLFVLIAGLCGLYFRFGIHDSQAISGFSKAYGQFDQAMVSLSNAIFSESPPDAVSLSNINSSVDATLGVLQEKSMMRISSLQVNDAEIMETTRDIAALAMKEVQLLQTYQTINTGAKISLEQLRLELIQLTDQRHRAYAHFTELSGIKN